MSAKSAQRFWENDMHRNKTQARRLNSFLRGALGAKRTDHDRCC
ncbi:MAG: cytidine deaminase, partial [Mesorhizobium sp.]